MSFTDSGTFLAWDPLRPAKTPLCLACGSAPTAPARCGGCKFAHFCGVECQKVGWAKHGPACEKGYAGYISSVEEHTKHVAKLQRDGAENEEVVEKYEQAFAAAEAMGDSEGQRHLAQVLSFRLSTHGHDARAEAYARTAARIEALIGKSGVSAQRVFDRVQGARLSKPALIAQPFRATAQPWPHSARLDLYRLELTLWDPSSQRPSGPTRLRVRAPPGCRGVNSSRRPTI